MEMTYGGALVMPSSYVMMDEEEMMYLEGGVVYRGSFALAKLTTMLKHTVEPLGYSSALADILLGTHFIIKSPININLQVTGIVAVALALGFTACIALGSYNAACLITALQLYDMYGGFNIDEVEIFGIPVYYNLGKP